MDAIKEDAGGVVVGDHEQGIMQCSDHPYNRSNPGGICAFCLKEKLGKLVSSPSFPLPVRASSSSSPSPSFRSNISVASATAAGAVIDNGNVGAGVGGGGGGSLAVTRKGRMIPFPYYGKKKKTTTRRLEHDVVLKRSKSATTPRRSHFFDFGRNGVVDFSPRTKKGTSFWSFLYMSSSSTTTTKPTITKTTSTPTPTSTRRNPTYGPTMKSNDDDKSIRDNNIVVVQEGDDPNTQGNETTSSCFERKVSRSRSVGCGSRSFSGDFFERISSGCGDCTSLRRVESQREGSSSKANKVHRGGATTTTTNPNMKGRVKCGGIFGGFTINSSSSSSFSSSSSSSSYWVSSSSSSSGEEVNNGKSTRGVHSRNRSWGWALASPMRAFTKQTTKDVKNNKNTKTIRESPTDKSTTPNLSAMPSLLATRS